MPSILYVSAVLIKSCDVLQKSFAYIQIIKPSCKNA